MSTAGLVVVVGTLIVAVVVGLLLRTRAGRVGAARRGAGSPGDWSELGAGAATSTDRVLLLQLSSPVCVPCRQAAEVLGDLVGRTPGLRHVEVDVSDRPELAATLRVMRTPTVIALDRSGQELLRVHGVPRVPELMDALAPALR